jgi:hypothetical protein
LAGAALAGCSGAAASDGASMPGPTPAASAAVPAEARKLRRERPVQQASPVKALSNIVSPTGEAIIH